MPPETRASLLIRIRDPQDTDSWTQFGEVYAPIVFRFLTRRGLQEADAGDVTQNVLLEVAKSIRNSSISLNKGNFVTGWRLSPDGIEPILEQNRSPHWSRRNGNQPAKRRQGLMPGKVNYCGRRWNGSKIGE